MFAEVYASTGTNLVQLTAVQSRSNPLPADRSSKNPPPETVRDSNRLVPTLRQLNDALTEVPADTRRQDSSLQLIIASEGDSEK